MTFPDRYAENRDVQLALKSTLEEGIYGHDFTGLIFMIAEGGISTNIVNMVRAT